MKNRKEKDVVIPGAERNRESTVKHANITSLTAGLPPVHAGNDSKRAFTLIELLVVVLIIGILAAVAVPQYQKAVLKSRVAAYLPKVDFFIKSQQLFRLANNDYASDLSSLGIDAKDWSGDIRSYAVSPQFKQTVKWEVQCNSKNITAYCVAIDSNELGKSICKQYWNYPNQEPDERHSGTFYLYKVVYL